MKKVIFSALFSLSVSFAFSQSFMHGAGFSIFVSSASGGETTPTGGITYSPRFNFIENDEMSVSVGVPITAGFSGSYNSRGYGESNSLSAMLNIPVMVNLNMGCGSTHESESRFGYFVGAGFGYHYGTLNYSDYYEDYSTSIHSYGPAGNAGIRIGVGNSGKNIEVKFSYMKGIDDSKANIFGGTALFNF
jgi:hypothetical protein